jgi:periplasmic protein TonB
MNGNLVIERPAGDPLNVTDAGNHDVKIIVSNVDDSKLNDSNWSISAIADVHTTSPISKVNEAIRESQILRFAPFSSSQTALAAPPVSQPRQLFSQSLVEMSGLERSRRRWTQSTSFIVQVLIVSMLVLLPFWFTDILPAQQLATFLIAPPPPPPPPAAPALKASKVVSEVSNGQLLAPDKIPQKIKEIEEEEAPAQITGVFGGVVGGVPGGSTGGVIGALISSASHTANIPTVAVPKRIRVSTGVSEGMLLHRVEPVYPVIAQRARIEGTVELRAIISKDGMIEGLQRISGHPLLVTAAMDAVRQWRYRPYMLNAEPLEVETSVVVNFHMH